MSKGQYVWIGAMLVALLVFFYYYSSMASAANSTPQITGNYGD
jgi:hypothetical protein